MSPSGDDPEREVEEIRQTLHDGENRIVAAPVSLRASWFPEYAHPSANDQLFSDYAASDPEPELARELEEEVGAFRDFLERGNQPGADSGQPGLPPAALSMMAGMNRRAQALSLWDRYAVPVRVRGARAYRIWAPRDVLGTPIIKSVPLPSYVAGVCERTAEDYLAIIQLNQKLSRWRTAATILGGLLILRVFL